MDGVASSRTLSIAYCFKCLCQDHAEVNVQRHQLPTLPPFIMPAETEGLPPEDDSIFTVSATPASYGSAALTSVCRDFPLVMNLVVGCLGLPLHLESGGESVHCPPQHPLSTLVLPSAAGRSSSRDRCIR